MEFDPDLSLVLRMSRSWFLLELQELFCRSTQLLPTIAE